VDGPQLVYVVTHPITALNLMRGQLEYLNARGFRVSVISSPAKELELTAKRENVSTLGVPISREIHLLRDCISLFRIYRILRRLKPEIVNASTPKAGFLGMIAAWLARVPVRIYTVRGLRLETKTGLQSFILSCTERIASACAHRIICVSESLRREFLSRRLASSLKTCVLATGSSNGVDVDRFSYPFSQEKKTTLRKSLGIPEDAMVMGFLGRLTRDKGIPELLTSFERLVPSYPNLCLLLVGSFEDGDPLPSECIRKIVEHSRIIQVSFLPDPVDYYTVIDFLVFPSHREGFPNAPLEAAALGIPTIGFRVTGTVDAVEDGVTGILVNAGDIDALVEAIRLYLAQDRTRVQHGKAARNRVVRLFRREHIWNSLFQEYSALLQKIKPVPLTPAKEDAGNI
jgi:glycosyltransferase involved in cell wall biosynthesis